MINLEFFPKETSLTALEKLHDQTHITKQIKIFEVFFLCSVSIAHYSIESSATIYVIHLERVGMSLSVL
jgi:hypothetical protein